MKITISARQFRAPFKGGVDVYADRLGRAFERMGHEVSYLSFDLKPSDSARTILVDQGEFQGSSVWRFTQTSERRHDQTFQLGYDHEMGERILEVLKQLSPDLLIVLNFYISTMATVEAAYQLGIPVAHIATDFIPVCRRATLIKANGEFCATGESIKSCAACFVSQRRIGRTASTLLQILPENSLVDLARWEADSGAWNPLHVLKPYLKQVRLTQERISILAKLSTKIDHIFAPTDFTARAFLDYGYRRDQVSTLPFAVEANNPFANLEHEPAGHIRFLFVGRLQPYKGVHILLAAFNQLANPMGATLDIYGVPDVQTDYFEGLKSEMEKSDRVRYHGRIEPERLGDAFSTADYFVLPSIWHENSPLILLDALQSQTPVIASRIGGVSDLIEDGLNGFLFPMGDVLALRDIMQKVIDQPAIRTGLQLNAKLSSIDEYASVVLEKTQSVPRMEAAASAT